MVRKYIFFIIFVLLFLNISLCIPIRSQDQSVNFFTKYRDKYVKNTVKTDFGIPGDGSLIDPVRFKSEATEAEQIAFEYLEQYLLAKEDICLDKRDIKITAIQESPGGTTVRFHQLKDGIPVYLTESSITINKKGIISWTNIFIRPEVMKLKETSGLRKAGTIDITAIRESIKAYFGFAGDELKIDSVKLTWFEKATKGAALAWETSVSTPAGTWGVCIDVENGEALQAGPSDYRADGWGYVFKPDPLTSAQIPYGGDYAYNGDKNNAALHGERKLVPLRDITYEGGQYKLEGPYCVLIDVEAPDICIGEHDTYPITRSDNLFDYTREEPEFEGVMCYYYIDRSARYLKSLGYWDKDGGSNAGLDRLQVDPHGSRCHSEFKMNLNIILMQEDYPSYDEVDAAEDAGVILHEYGHAIEHNIGPGLTSAAYGEPESSAIWEGSADYWDITHRASLSSYEWSKHAHWRQKGHTLPDARTADVGFAYPYENNYHVGGQIWSSALMNIWWKIGKKTTDILFLETIKRLEQIPSFAKAAMTFINNDYDLYQGRHRKEILESFDRYGLVDYIDQIPYQIESNNHLYRADIKADHARYNDFDLPGADGADNEHFLHLAHPARLNISTSSPKTNFDTKIQIFTKELIPTSFYADDGAGPDPTHAMLTDITLPAGDYYIVVDGNNGALGEYELTVEYAQPLEVHLADERLSETNRSKPAFFIRNAGSQAISDFRVSYYFQVENGKTPVFEDVATPDCTPTLEALGNGHYRINFDFTGVALNPGQSIPAAGETVVRIHYPDWSEWDKTNDYSQPAVTSPALSNKIAVFNNGGELIYGSVPDIFPPDPSRPELKVYILDEAFGQSNAVQPRLYIENLSDTPFSDFVVRYCFTVENGKTPVCADYWTPNFAIALEQLSSAQWCAALDYTGYTLPAKGRAPENSGEVFGLHYTDWSSWDKANDFSQPPSNSYTLTDKVAVFDSAGFLVYGNQP